MNGAETAIHSVLAERTAAGEAMFIAFWLILFLGCALVAIAIKDSEKTSHDLALQRTHAAGMAAGYKLCRSEGR